jgi:glyoxylase I family protein
MGSARPPTGRTIVNKAAAVAGRSEGVSEGAPQILGESHVQLRVTDLNRSARFYAEVVGLREHVRSKVQVILTCGPWQVGLVASVHRASDPRTDDRPQIEYSVNHAGLQHLAFALGSAADVDAAATWLDAHSVRRMPVSDGFTPGSRYVTFYDPDGIPLEYYFMDAAYADLYGVQLE